MKHLTFLTGRTSIASTMLAVSAFSFGASYATAAEQNLVQQRLAYQQAQDLLDKKDIKAYQELRPKIETYSLTPYTDYRAFLVNLDEKSPDEVNHFITQFDGLPFSGRIRAPYLRSLAQQEKWQTLLEFQKQPPVGEEYLCLYHYAQYETQQSQAAFAGAEQLWLSGKDISARCDPLFSAWSEAGLRTDELILQRMLLAFEQRNLSTLQYLAKLPASDLAQVQAKDMLALFQKPQLAAVFAEKHKITPFYQKQTELAVQLWARKDAVAASKVIEGASLSQNLGEQRTQALRDYAIFRVINSDDPKVIEWRDSALMSSASSAMLERRAQLAVQHGDWQGIIRWISRLPQSNQSSLRWQYWQGRAEMALGRQSQGEKRLNAILGERNFYSVAAATALNKTIQYPEQSITFDKTKLAADQKALERVKELIDVDKISAAKSEWRWLLRNASIDEKQMLAAYAGQQRWHHLTVLATISAKMWDYMDLRFPLAHRWWFNFYAEKHDLDPITLVSLARQESALDVDANSPVGARGLMQIMPTTASHTAKKFKIDYSGADDLYIVEKNIEIGSQYLASLLDQYDNNRIFALAAYNAGPNRVKQWRERSAGQLDPYAFIESIPFKETRGYVQNILMFETYYRNLLNVEGDFLTESENKAKY
ncbi:lytic murein transglycosylase [Vibrio sp. 10N.286.49.B3]|nr:lytic murein transglycosylase [Vibrio sp. 10N.286.49.B3]